MINSWINASRSDQLTIRKATFSAVNVFGQFDIFHHVGHYKLTLGPLHHYFMSEKKQVANVLGWKSNIRFSIFVNTELGIPEEEKVK